jgi:hypothetical protein
MSGNGDWDVASMDLEVVLAAAARQWIAFGRKLGRGDATILAVAPEGGLALARLLSRDEGWCGRFVAAFPAAVAEALARSPGAN